MKYYDNFLLKKKNIIKIISIATEIKEMIGVDLLPHIESNLNYWFNMGDPKIASNNLGCLKNLIWYEE